MSAVAVDWSGAKRPAGKIWIAHANDGALRELDPLETRDQVVAQLVQHWRRNPDTVAGLDFGFSFPAWFLRHHLLSNAFDLWDLARRDGERWLRECDWPFWGRPGKRKPDLQADHRRTEQRVGSIKGVSPKSCFQIGGAGAVGTGTIRGMPFLMRLREEGCAVWPFDKLRQPLLVEIYPRALTGEVIKSSTECRAEYLQRWPQLTPALAERAIRSEDAFDAAVSALIMDAHINTFRCLENGDDVAQVEGEIWVPEAPPNQAPHPASARSS